MTADALLTYALTAVVTAVQGRIQDFKLGACNKGVYSPYIRSAFLCMKVYEFLFSVMQSPLDGGVMFAAFKKRRGRQFPHPL